MKYEKPKIKTKDHQMLWVTHEEYHSGGDIVEGEEDEAFPNREDAYIDWQLLKVSLSEPSSLYRDPVKVKCSKFVRPGDNMYLVVVRYSSGDTFGHSSGHAYVEGVYDTKDCADLVAAMIEAGSYPSSGGYLPWVGYFESLESVEIHNITVEL